MFIKKSGAIAQLVEQRTENPCVPGSIPGGTTENLSRSNSIEVFSYLEVPHTVILFSGNDFAIFVRLIVDHT